MTTKLLYKPFGLIFGMVAGAIAGALFKRTWRALADEEEAPKATDRDSGLLEITAGAAIHAAVFAGTRASRPLRRGRVRARHGHVARQDRVEGVAARALTSAHP